MNQKTKRIETLHLMALAIAIFALCSAVIANGKILTGSVMAAPNLVLSANQPPNPLAPSASFTSVVTLTNSGDAGSGASTVRFSFPQPGSTVTRSITYGAGITCSGVAPRYGAAVITCTVPAIAAGASKTIVTVTAAAANVTAAGTNYSISAAGPTNSVSVSWQWRIAGLADLTAFISTTPNPIIVGRSATTSVTVNNNGFLPANGFNTHVSVPGIISSVTSGSTPAAVCSFAGGEIDCLMSITNGGSQSLTIIYTAATVPGTYPATVSADTANVVAESSETNNTGSNPLTITDSVVRLHTTTVNPIEVVGQTVFTRTITVRNDGTIDALNVQLFDRQKETQFVSANTPAGMLCAAWFTTGAFNLRYYAGTVCSIGTLPVGATVSLDVRLSAPTAYSSPTTLLNTTSASTTSFQDPLDSSSSQGSLSLVAASGAVAPTNTVAPTLTGNANIGSVFSTNNGSWVGTSPFTYTYQWQRCDGNGSNCANIAGATANTYTVQAGDAGMTIKSVVTATNAGGATAASSAVSAAVISAAPPVNSIAPALIPALEIHPGYTWSVTGGTWSGTPTIVYTYQWQRCDLNGGNCVNIDGATYQYYTLQNADVLNQVRVRVTATNSGGSSVSFSNLSGEIDPVG